MISIDEGQGVQSCLPDKYSLMCSQANSTLEDMKRRIYNGTISLEEIGVVYAKKHQVLKLCAVSLEYDIEETILELRNRECTAFKRHKTRVASFCREVQRLQIEGTLPGFFAVVTLYSLSESANTHSIIIIVRHCM